MKQAAESFKEFSTDVEFEKPSTEFFSSSGDQSKIDRDRPSNYLSKQILQKADINKHFYLKTYFSSFQLGYALFQPDYSEKPKKLCYQKMKVRNVNLKQKQGARYLYY